VEGHGRDGARYQDVSVIVETGPDGGLKVRKGEHFGFADGISEVAFDGQGADLRIEGGGKLTGKVSGEGRWLPHALGEFLLGHPDESQELPPTAPPSALMRNGTFMAYRKLHQNVRAFNDYVARTAKAYAAANECTPGEASEILKAKMVGRWQEGVPLSVAPTLREKNEFLAKYNAEVEAANAWKKQAEADGAPADAEAIETEHQRRLADARRPFIDFTYHDDTEGIRCPVGAHIRRTNTRDMLDAENGTSILNNRRRILRRGLPYGTVRPDAAEEGEHGVVFLAFCASLFRQFEFIQQQWLNYGLDFNAGNDGCPILGNRQEDNPKFVIAVDPNSGKAPFICANLPQFVETRGGEYFFVPSLTALRMMAMGTVDPT
jgi:Dyp-type peroxidase family